MIMILSDGGSGVKAVQKQLELRDERYLMYFTDFTAAGRYGGGIVFVGDGSAASIRKVIVQNKVTALIDAGARPKSEVSAAAIEACGDTIIYVKYLGMEDSCDARMCLSYRQLASMMQRCRGNFLMYASHTAVSAVAELESVDASRIYVPVVSCAGFDTESALKYGVPIRNIIAADGLDGADAVSAMIDKTDASMIICDSTAGVSDKTEAARRADIPVIVTHGMGMEYPYAAASAADAVISVRTRGVDAFGTKK